MIRLVRTKVENGKNVKKICPNFPNWPLRGTSNLQTSESLSSPCYTISLTPHSSGGFDGHRLLLVPHGEVPSSADQANDSPETRTLSGTNLYSGRILL